MRAKHHYHIYRRKFRLCAIKSWVLTVVVCIFLLPSYAKFEKNGNNLYHISLNGIEVGVVANESVVEGYLIEARKNVVSGSDDLIFIEADVEVIGEEKLVGRIDSSEKVIKNMEGVLRQSIVETLKHSYTVKIHESTFNLSSHEDVYELLRQAISVYDTEGLYDVSLVLDPGREVNVLTTQINKKEDMENVDEVQRQSAGIGVIWDDMVDSIEPAVEKSFDDFQQGLIDIGFADTIEIVESYLMESEIIPVEKALNSVTKEQEMQIIYKVESGDTLSQISIKNDIPLDDLIAINDSLEDENTTIRVGQELVITVPEPDLSICWKDEQIYIEEYDAPIEYVPNDNWYTTQRKTIQEPSAGVRKIVAVTEYKNGKVVNREILKEEVYAEAVAKVVERGTKIPPTYIKPISGGRVSSNFGSRSAPTAGASTYHKGIDWAVATGTSVVAANAGRVVTAGWVSGYGYAVYIDHGDGRQTRYGHLSKVLVKPGQYVAQGERIALSGNTGRSTGPHLHFEIRINGQAVNPLKYLS